MLRVFIRFKCSLTLPMYPGRVSRLFSSGCKSSAGCTAKFQQSDFSNAKIRHNLAWQSMTQEGQCIM